MLPQIIESEDPLSKVSENKSTEIKVCVPGFRARGHPVTFLSQQGIITYSPLADSTILQ